MIKTTFSAVITVILLAFSPLMLADALWLDVRTAAEYQEGHVEQASNIPHDIIVTGEATINAEKDALIYVYCKSGNRANKAKNALQEQGYERVINLGSLSEAQRYLQLNPEQ